MLLLVGAIVAWDWKSSLAEDAWRATWQSGLSRAAFLVLVFLFAAALLGCGWPPPNAVRLLPAGALLARFRDPRADAKPGRESSVYAPGWARAQLKLNPEPKLGGSRVMLSPAALEFLRYNPTASLEETYLRNRLAHSRQLQPAG